MTLFLSVFFALYALLHVYFFVKAKAALAFGIRPALLLVSFLIIMVISPPVVRMSERAGYETFARILAYAGYSWLGFLFLFCSYSFLLDTVRLALKIPHLLAAIKLPATALFTPRRLFLLPLILAMGTAVYGAFEARNIRLEHLVVRTPKVSGNAGMIRIVQISDVHFGIILREEMVERVAKAVEEAAPDILVSTGDLVDGEICGINGLSERLRRIETRYGKFAVTGNHEFYAGLDQARCFAESAGFRLLRGESVTAGGITIAGVDDPVGKRYRLASAISEGELLASGPGKGFVLFLKHRPVIEEGSLGLFDLQLSGHVHKGQIFPFSIFTRMYYGLHAGFKKLGGGSAVYVSRGTGTWGPPIRFLSPPEITVIDLLSEA